MTKENETITNKNKKIYCGFPGINGGYFQNKNLLLGVNCYGKKPPPTPRAKPPTSEKEDVCSLNVNYNASHKLNSDEII
jgi:hypothetical protein